MIRMNAQQINRESRFNSNIRNLEGTFAVEGMVISDKTRKNLDRLAAGIVTYQQLINELKSEYAIKEY